MRRGGQVVGYGNLGHGQTLELWTNRRVEYNRWDLILTPFILNSQERQHHRGTETWWSLTLMSLPLYLKVQITLTSYANLEPQTSLEWFYPNHYFLVCIFWFPEREVCYFPSCHASLSHINTQEERERIYYGLKAVNISIHLSKNYIFCQFILRLRRCLLWIPASVSD